LGVEDADQLYGLPLAEFVPARNALVKQLRADGRRDEAAAVATLAKPSVAAWAANQVLRSQPKDARELLAAGDALAAADSTTLREAITRHRDVISRLLRAANGLLDPDGRSLSATTLERVQQTLNAASLDPELREQATGARLENERVYSGLGLGAAPDEEPRPKNKGKAKKTKATPDRAEQEARRKAETARREHAANVAAAQKRLAAAEKRQAAARERLAAARADVAAAQDALDELT
jgi:hypothetical protein